MNRDIAPDYRRLAALSWLHFLNDGAANYLPGVLPAVLLSLGLNIGLAGAVMTALLLGQTLQPATGWLADHFGGRLLIVAGVLGTSLGGAAVGLVSAPWALILALLVTGLTNALFHPQAMAAARRVGGERPGLSLSIFLVGGEIGRGVWPLLASLVVVHQGLSGLWLLAVPALVSVPLLVNRLPRQPPHDASTRIDWRAHAGPAALLIAFCVLRALAIFGTTTFLPLWWHARGYGLVAGAGTITVLLVVGIIGNVGGGHLADRIGRKPVLIGSGVLGAVLLVAVLLSDGALQWLLLGALGIMLFAALPLSILLAQDLFPENRSFGSGLALGLANGLAALALIPLGVLGERCGPQLPLWMLVAALLLATLLVPRLAATPAAWVFSAGTRPR